MPPSDKRHEHREDRQEYHAYENAKEKTSTDSEIRLGCARVHCQSDCHTCSHTRGHQDGISREPCRELGEEEGLARSEYEKQYVIQWYFPCYGRAADDCNLNHD